MLKRKHGRTRSIFVFLSGTYFAVVMTLVALSCLATVVVLIVHHRGDQGRRVPELVKEIFFKRLAPVLYVNTGDDDIDGGCFCRVGVKSHELTKILLTLKCRSHTHYQDIASVHFILNGTSSKFTSVAAMIPVF